MDTGTKTKKKAGEVDLHQYYLVSGYVNNDGSIADGSVLPINNTVIALKDDGNKFIVSTDGKASAESLQLYITDADGRICNFDAGSQSKADEKEVSAKPLEASNYLKAISEQAKLYFPPKRSVLYHMASSGYDNWATTLRELLNTFENTSAGNAYFDLKAQMNAKKSLLVSSKFSKPENVNNKAYETWYKDHKDHDVPIIFIPRVKAVIVAFSSDVYLDSIVTIRNHLGELCFLGSDATGEEKYSATVKESPNQKDYCATFYAGEDDYAMGESIYQQVYRIEVEPPVDFAKKLGAKKYVIAEKFRFDINNIAGDFQIINGDAISLEESMIKQFPLLYTNLLEASYKVPDSDKSFLAPYLHGAGLAKDNASAVSGILGAKSGQSSAKKIGSYIVSNVDVIGNATYGGISAKEVIDVAFSLHDAAGGIEADFGKLAAVAPELIQGATETFDAAVASVKNTEFARKVESYAEISGVTVAAAWDKATEKAVQNGTVKKIILKKIELSTATQRWVDIKLYKSRKVRKVLGSDSVSAKIGVISAGLGLASGISGWWQSDTNGDNAVKTLADVAYQYSHYLNQLDVNDDKKIEDNKEKEDKIRQAVNIYKQYFNANNKESENVKVEGDSISININFPFDRHSFDSQKHEKQITDFVKATSILGEDCSVVLVGHTCDLGKDNYNLALSIRRAAAVKAALQAKGSTFDIRVEGRGETGNSEGLSREQQRRVEAVVHTTFSRRYFPSREGMDSLERFRSQSVLFYREENEQIKAAMKAAVESILCYPHPVTAAAGVLWAAGSLLMDAGALLDKLVSGSDAVKIINDHDSKGIESADNLILMTAGLKNPDPKSRYLQSQFRLRAETLYGLVRLLMRCSVETSDGWYDAWRSSTNTKWRDKFNYEENLKYYRVEDYINIFVLRDGWQLPSGLALPISIDQHWIQLIEDDILDAILASADSSTYEKIDAGLEKYTGLDVADLAAGINPVTRLALLNDLASAASKTALFSPIQGFDYIRFSQSDNYKSHEKDVLTAQYQSFFPVHYHAAKDLESFAAKFKTNFKGLTKEKSLAYCGISVRGLSNTAESLSGWVPLENWLKEKGSLSPMDQIRICVFLNPADETVASLIKDGSITYVPVECAPIRRDGLNIPGPAVKGFISKIAEGQLLSEEKEALDALKDDEGKDLLVKGAPLYGAILNPFYMFGITRINGTRPMAGEVSSWLNVDIKDEDKTESLDRYWNFDGVWNMRYAYEVMLAKNADCVESVTYIDDEDEFPLSIDVDRVHKIGGSKGSQPESKLLNKHFLLAGKNREPHPPLFEQPKVYCLLRNPDTGEIFESNKILSDHKSHGFIRELIKNDFRWDQPLEVIVLLVSEGLTTWDYPGVNLPWKTVPMILEIGKLRGRDYNSGTKYKSTFQYLGRFSGEGATANFIRDTEATDTKKYKKFDPMLEKMISLFEKPSIVEGYSKGKACFVHAVHIPLDYQTLTGERKKGLRPFLVNPNATVDEVNDWAFGFKITTAGDSGLKGLRAEDNYQVNGPVGLMDVHSHWYPSPKAEFLARYKEVMDRVKDDIKTNENSRSYDPAVMLSHWHTWRSLIIEGQTWWGDDWTDVITNWAHDSEGASELSGSAPMLR
ncbi:MAG: outer membrane protein OmpA-like peptidoglycan-associated protein [Oleispira sp.]|jgi:outer membrane protein OmpA-like peptidoglycan-associated protein